MNADRVARLLAENQQRFEEALRAKDVAVITEFVSQARVAAHTIRGDQPTAEWVAKWIVASLSEAGEEGYGLGFQEALFGAEDDDEEDDDAGADTYYGSGWTGYSQGE